MIILIVVLDLGEKTEYVRKISVLCLIYFRRYSPLNSVPEWTRVATDDTPTHKMVSPTLKY